MLPILSINCLCNGFSTSSNYQLALHCRNKFFLLCFALELICYQNRSISVNGGKRKSLPDADLSSATGLAFFKYFFSPPLPALFEFPQSPKQTKGRKIKETLKSHFFSVLKCDNLIKTMRTFGK